MILLETNRNSKDFPKLPRKLEPFLEHEVDLFCGILFSAREKRDVGALPLINSTTYVRNIFVQIAIKTEIKMLSWDTR